MKAIWRATLVLTASSMIMATPALAEPASEAAPKAPIASPAPSTPAPDEDAATRLVEQAAQAYDEGRLDEALRVLTRAYDLSPRPAIIYNQAQVLRAKNDCAAALEAYRRFIAATLPGDPNRERAARHQTEMQSCLDKQPRSGGAVHAPTGTAGDRAAAPAGSTQPPPATAAAAAAGTATAAPPRRLTLDREPHVQTRRKITAPTPGPVPDRKESGAHQLARVSGWALLGVSVVSAGAAAVLAWRAARLQSEASQEIQSESAAWNSTLQSHVEDGERAALLARWCGAAAALSASGGATLLLMFRSPSSSAEAAQPHAAAALVGWSGVF